MATRAGARGCTSERSGRTVRDLSLGWFVAEKAESGCARAETRHGNRGIMRNDRVLIATSAALLLLLASVASPGTCDTSYKVQRGDSVWLIAQRFDASWTAILAANGLRKDSVIRPGRELVIPAGPASQERSEPTASEADSVRHTVQPGDSLWTIARDHGITVRGLARANGLRPDGILRVARELIIPAPAAEAEQDAAEREEPPERVHVVRSGESLWLIARRFGTSVAALAAANDMRSHGVLRVGRQLTIPGAGSPGDAEDEASEKDWYVVQRGDNLWIIAHRYGTNVYALAEANGLRADRVLRVGIRLEVPAGADTSESDGEGNQGFVQTAMKYQGVRYRYGGLTTRGIDCSGLVVRVLRAHGIDAPHNSKALYRLGTPVSRDKLVPGDLVFFHTTRPGISHVGICIGGGKFIHASSGKGRVAVSRLDEGYYRRRLVGARRVR